MDTVRICKKCRKPLPDNVPEGLCPQCFSTISVEFEPAPHKSRVAVEPAELAPFFPQLEIIQLLGMGGMGMVYKARQPQLDRFVALKILPKASAQHPSFADRFNREAKALAKLNHPGIVGIYDFGQAGPYYYFLMEYVDGMNLRQMLDLQPPTPRQTVDLVVQICTALQFAHDEGVVHRDIKPANILVNKKGQVKIADFGLAKLLGTAPDSSLTTTQAAMGTMDYMAPEQRQNAQGVDHRADIYSLGVVFYEMLTGEVPIGRFEPPSKKAKVDVRLDEVVLRSLESEPSRRYQHASELRSGVEEMETAPATRPGKKPWGTMLAILSAAALVTWIVWPRPSAPISGNNSVKLGPLQLVARASNLLERYDLPGHVDSAIADLREAKQMDPTLTDAHALLGLAYWRRYRQTTDAQYRAEAWNSSSNALACNRNSVTGLFVRGLVAQEEGRFNEATNSLLLANELAAWENGEILIQIAKLYRSLAKMTNSPSWTSDASNSLAFAKKARQVLKKPWYFYNGLGAFELGSDHIEAATSNFQAAIDVASDSPMAWGNLGAVLISAYGDQSARAMVCFQKAIQFGGPTENACNYLGEYYMNCSNWLAAATNFEAAAQLNPKRYDFAGNEGLALIHLPQEQARGKELLLKALDKLQSNHKGDRTLQEAANVGLYQAGLSQAEEAYATLMKLTKSYPSNAVILANVEAAADILDQVYHSSEAERLRQLLPQKTDQH